MPADQRSQPPSATACRRREGGGAAHRGAHAAELQSIIGKATNLGTPNALRGRGQRAPGARRRAARGALGHQGGLRPPASDGIRPAVEADARCGAWRKPAAERAVPWTLCNSLLWRLAMAADVSRAAHGDAAGRRRRRRRPARAHLNSSLAVPYSPPNLGRAGAGRLGAGAAGHGVRTHVRPPPPTSPGAVCGVSPCRSTQRMPKLFYVRTAGQKAHGLRQR